MGKAHELPCAYCGEPVDTSKYGFMRAVTGWEEVRSQGGTHALSLRTTTGHVAHKLCVAEEKVGGDQQARLW
jgi:hypothetical protein